MISRANEILSQLESQHVEGFGSDAEGNQQKSKMSIKEKMKEIASPQFQLSIFDAHSETFEDIRKLLTDIDINRLTPVEALLKLQEIKNKIN